MADKKMSALDAAASVGDSDIMHVVQSGANKKATKAVLHTGLTKNADTNVKANSWVVDEDNMASDLDTKVPTQQSVKAYADGISSAKADATHATQHTDGTDDIQDATDAQKGLATAAQITKLDGIEASADVTDATNVDAAGATMNTDADVSGNSWVLDEDAMGTDSDTQVPTQQSVKAYVDTQVGGVSGELYWDCTVNGAGGADYTTLKAAYDDGNKRILMTGNTTETADIAGMSNVIIHGNFANPSNQPVITMAGYKFTGNVQGCHFKDVSISSTLTSGALFEEDVQFCLFENVFFQGSSASTGAAYFDGGFYYTVISRCRFDNSKMVFYKNTSNAETHSLLMEHCYCNSSACNASDYWFNSDWDEDGTTGKVLIQNCYIVSAGRILSLDANGSTVSDANQGFLIQNCNMYWAASVPAFYLEYCKVDIVGSRLRSASDGQLIDIYGSSTPELSLTNCQLENVSSIVGSDTNTNYMVKLVGCTFEEADVRMSESDTPTYEPMVEVYGSSYSGIGSEQEQMMDRKIVWLENASGGALAQGDVVTLVSTSDAAGSRLEVGTTTSADDEMAFGVVARGGADGAAVAVLTQGFCYHTKVDGTTDIATDDLLGTFTTAGIAAKSTTRGARFAKAIGGYTSDDSSGDVKTYLFGHMR